MNYPREDVGVFHRRTEWLNPNESSGTSNYGVRIKNREWLEKEKQRFIDKGIRAEVRTNEFGEMAVFADNYFCTHTSRSRKYDE